MTDPIPFATLSRATLPAYAFFPVTPERLPLFAVREGVPLQDALEMASCILASVLSAANSCDSQKDNGLSALAYLIEVAKGIADAAVECGLREGRTAPAPGDADLPG